MDRIKCALLVFTTLFISHYCFSQPEPNDTSQLKKPAQKIKTGWSFGAVPAVAYDSDIGFKGGAVVELWDYGDGSNYPKYNHHIFLEYSRTTKGSGITELRLDSRKLIPGLRSSSEISYLTERALDFYGFNGYESYYNPEFENDAWNNTEYISRVYYRQERKLLRLRSDLQGRFLSDKAKWIAGITYYNIKTDTVDINRLNRGKVDSLKLPPAQGGLYGQYAYQWNLIPDDQIHGGSTTLLKAGFIYDTRDNEPNPMRGIWTECLFFWAPDFLGSGNYGYSKFAFTHRQYFTLLPERLSLVYRLSYQAKLWGTMPYYMLPLVLNGGTEKDRDGLGGAKTIRGILRNRIVGEDYVYGNLELRWKFIKRVWFKQNFYLALNTFLDVGMVSSKYNLDLSHVPEESLFLFANKEETLHKSMGAGFHIAMNENFVIAINQGFALNNNDGDKGLYIGLKWLF